jgi:hypothetical protein
MSNGGTTFVNVGTGAGGVGASTVTLEAVFNFFSGQDGQAVNFSLFNPNSPCTVQALNLISGANTISATNCPAIATASGVFLIPPAGNGATLTIKGVSGDTGIAIAYTGNPSAAPSFLSFAATPPSSFVITTNSTVTGFILAWV